VAGEEWLEATERRAEALTLGLRTARGIKLPAGGADDSPVATWFDALSAAGLLASTDDDDGVRVVLTRPGRLLANEVTARLLAALDAVASGAPDCLALPRPGTR
jgi:hypothetical protein